MLHVGGGVRPAPAQSVDHYSHTTRDFSSQDTISLLTTHHNSPFDFHAASQGDPNKNCDSSASNDVDGEPKRDNPAFKKPYFGWWLAGGMNIMGSA